MRTRAAQAAAPAPAPAPDHASSPGSAAPEGRGRWRVAPRYRPLLLAALMVLLALPPRLLDTDRFVTTDELFWIGRSAAFGRGLETGQFGQTFQTGHPGVTTMWTGWLGMGPRLAREMAPSRRDVSRREVSQSPSFMAALAAARRGFGVVTALGVGVVVLLAWRIFGGWPAAIGGVLLALDPFFLAHSRLVHIDASVTLWMTLAGLAALHRWYGGGWPSLVLAGVATGLALLSKAPAGILLPLIPLALQPFRGYRYDPPRLIPGLRDVAIWAVIAGLTFVVAWPAMWTAPTDTLVRLTAFVRDNANPDHAAAADDEGTGLAFYPLVLLLRTTPLTLVGLAALLLPPWRCPSGRAVPALIVFCLAYGTAMTVAAKGFDRYLLPIFPALDLLAGVGWWRLIVLLTRWRGPATETLLARRQTIAGLAACGVALMLGGWWVIGSWPYELTYANPLLGGNPAAHRTIASGWGEGLDQAAAYLNARFAGDRLRTAMPGEIYTTVLDAQLNGTVAPAEGADAGAYDALVVYLRNRQVGDRPPFFDDELLAWVPDQTVTLNGVEYAWVYGTKAGAPVGATFGGMLTLDGYGLDTVNARVGRRLELRLRWRPLQQLPKGLGAIVELRPADGSRVFRLNLPLDPSGESSAWALEERTSVAYGLNLDPSLVPGAYTIAVRVVGADGNPLPVTTQPSRPPGVPSEVDAVPLRRVQVR